MSKMLKKFVDDDEGAKEDFPTVFCAGLKYIVKIEKKLFRAK